MTYSIRKGSNQLLPEQGLPTTRICHHPYRQSRSRGVRAALSECKTVQYNGKDIAYVSKADVAFLCREIEEKRCYFQHGISLAKGDTVIDVGANIGIFAAQAAREVSSSGRVIACEPLPATFAALQHNMQSLLSPGTSITCSLLASSCLFGPLERMQSSSFSSSEALHRGCCSDTSAERSRRRHGRRSRIHPVYKCSWSAYSPPTHEL